MPLGASSFLRYPTAVSPLPFGAKSVKNSTSKFLLHIRYEFVNLRF
jgi:hypothetical protein